MAVHGGELACRRVQPFAEAEQREFYRARVTRADLGEYLALSTVPMTPANEQLMEKISHLVTKEDLATVFEPGEYQCAHCHQTLYVSASKWVGPCLWPTFRAPEAPGALHRHAVTGYNGYRCDTAEISCGQCRLFLGHIFQDGKEQGDTHPDADYRHCVLSLSLAFVPCTPNPTA